MYIIMVKREKLDLVWILISKKNFKFLIYFVKFEVKKYNFIVIWFEILKLGIFDFSLIKLEGSKVVLMLEWRGCYKNFNLYVWLL